VPTVLPLPFRLRIGSFRCDSTRSRRGQSQPGSSLVRPDLSRLPQSVFVVCTLAVLVALLMKQRSDHAPSSTVVPPSKEERVSCVDFSSIRPLPALSVVVARTVQEHSRLFFRQRRDAVDSDARV